MKQYISKRERSLWQRTLGMLSEMFFDDSERTMSQENRRNKRVEDLLQVGLVMLVLVVLHLCLPMA